MNSLDMVDRSLAGRAFKNAKWDQRLSQTNSTTKPRMFVPRLANSVMLMSISFLRGTPGPQNPRQCLAT